MVGMRSVVVDKLASVTQACGLSHEVRIATDIPAEEGVVVVVEVLNNKSTYNTLELTSGRMAKVGQGRHRRRRPRAPQGAVRLLRPRTRRRCSPATSSRCSTSAACSACATRSIRTRASPSTAACSASRSTSPTSASASACRRASATSASTRTRRSRRAACRSWRSPAPAWKRARPPPPARSSSRMRHRGLTVDAFKATGVSLRRDILAMEDAGARRCAIFTDLGIVTTTRSQRTGAHAHHAHRARRR